MLFGEFSVWSFWNQIIMDTIACSPSFWIYQKLDFSTSWQRGRYKYKLATWIIRDFLVFWKQILYREIVVKKVFRNSNLQLHFGYFAMRYLTVLISERWNCFSDIAKNRTTISIRVVYEIFTFLACFHDCSLGISNFGSKSFTI